MTLFRRYFLYVPGMPFDGRTIHTRSLGGSESAGYYLALGLARAGNEVVVFCNAPQPCDVDGVSYVPLGPQSERFPFGQAFQETVRNVPHDVTICQRAPGVFSLPMCSQLRFWWTHDLAQGRMREAALAGLWNCHGVLAVSEWHRRQVMQVYGLPGRFVHVLPNGVDLGLFGAPIRPSGTFPREGGRDESEAAVPPSPFMGEGPGLGAAAKLAGMRMVYSSRPERGLRYLAQPDGIMARLARRHPEITLLVCSYDHAVPQMAPLYAQLKAWAEALPNVALLEPKTKAGMARLMDGAWLHVYPVVPPGEFEEVSCVAAMEAQAGGTPCVVPRYGALPETLGDLTPGPSPAETSARLASSPRGETGEERESPSLSVCGEGGQGRVRSGGAAWVTEPGEVHSDELYVQAFVNEICDLAEKPERWLALHERALAKAPDYSADKPAARVSALASVIQREAAQQPARLAQCLMHNSDALAMRGLTPWPPLRREERRDVEGKAEAMMSRPPSPL